MVKQTALSPSPSTADTTSRDRSCCQFKGVRKRKWGKWVSEIRLPNSRERIWLGSYDSPRKAARAFDAALFCLRGGSAAFNFPHSPPDILGGRSLTHSQIRVAAAKFANDAAEPPPPATPSVSEGTTELMEVGSEGAASEAGSSASLFDFTTVAAAASVLDFGNVYSGFDDLSGSFYNDYYTVPQTAADSVEENWEGELASFLWNF